MIRRITGLALMAVAIVIFQPMKCQAASARSREISGVVQTVNTSKHLLTLKLYENKRPLAVAWTPHTEFLRGSKLVGIEKLQPGVPARIYYRSPFFGNRYATKVILSGQE